MLIQCSNKVSCYKRRNYYLFFSLGTIFFLCCSRKSFFYYHLYRSLASISFSLTLTHYSFLTHSCTGLLSPLASRSLFSLTKSPLFFSQSLLSLYTLTLTLFLLSLFDFFIYCILIPLPNFQLAPILLFFPSFLFFLLFLSHSLFFC